MAMGGSGVGGLVSVVGGWGGRDLGGGGTGLLGIAAGVGAWLWVDFAGGAGPALTADRARVRAFGRVEDQTEWTKRVDGLFIRWLGVAKGMLAADGEARAAFLFLGAFEAALRAKLPLEVPSGPWSLERWGGASDPVT